MPGTILVSVLEFKNILPTSLWVSMGKRAYQTWDKGDFSFPLTTFRENLVVRIEDAEGNEISRTEVETLLIVEKGYWDDLFQVEGGYVHMKLQFILTEDDRNRIRNLRESALKKRKKQDKVPAANVEYSETGITAQDSIAPSMPVETDSGKNVVHLLEDCHIGVDDHQRKKRPMQEVTGKRGFFHISDSIIKKEREKTRKSESGSSGNNGSSGPIRQVIKIAVIVGFGIFVLLTRQKENRRGDRKSKDGPDFMDQLASSDDKWSLLTADGD